MTPWRSSSAGTLRGCALSLALLGACSAPGPGFLEEEYRALRADAPQPETRPSHRAEPGGACGPLRDPGPVREAADNPLQGLRFEELTGNGVARSWTGSPRVVEIGMDALVRVSVDEDTLLGALGESLPETTSSIHANCIELEGLLEICRELPKQKALLLDAWLLESRLRETQGAAPGEPERLTAATEATNSALRTFRSRAMEGLDGLLAYAEKTSDPELRDSLVRAMENPRGSQDSYAQLPSLVARELAKLTNQLEGDLAARRMRIRLAAVHQTSLGDESAVHLVGYDDLPSGPYQPFERFQIALDEEVRAELQAAEQLEGFLKELSSQRFRDEWRRVLAELRTRLDQLPDALRQEALQGLEEALRRALDSVPPSDRALVQDLWNTVRSLRIELERLAQLWDADLDPRQWLELFAGARDVVRSFSITLELLQSLAHVLERNLPHLTEELEQEFGARLRALLTALSDGLLTPAQRSYFEQLIENLSFFLTYSNSSEELVNALEELSRTARAFAPAEAPDTEIDVAMLRAERHDGDRIVLQLVVEDATGNELFRGQQRMRLRILGLYMRPRGFLMFADPRGPTSDNESYQLAPAFGWYLHYGMAEANAFYELLEPGVGFGVTALDFDDQESLEVGVSLSAVFWKNLFHVGYGWNLQADEPYFYLGFNPLVAARLFQDG